MIMKEKEKKKERSPDQGTKDRGWSFSFLSKGWQRMIFYFISFSLLMMKLKMSETRRQRITIRVKGKSNVWESEGNDLWRRSSKWKAKSKTCKKISSKSNVSEKKKPSPVFEGREEEPLVELTGECSRQRNVQTPKLELKTDKCWERERESKKNIRRKYAREYFFLRKKRKRRMRGYKQMIDWCKRLNRFGQQRKLSRRT